jgi:hypothetical protein
MRERRRALGRPIWPPSTHRNVLAPLDQNTPIRGVTLRVRGSAVATATDEQGYFTLAGVPVGDVHLVVDGSTAQRPGTWPDLEYEVVTVPGANNTLGMPIFLLPLDTAHAIFVDETHGGTLTLPEYPGFSLTVAPNSATFPDGTRRGTISVTVVHADKVPMVPNFGQQPRFIVTIQPPGVKFDPPAQVTHPNVDGLPPGHITELYSFDHDMGSFVATGTATVSADGTTLVSDPGTGIIKGGWHCGGDPQTRGTVAECPVCQICVGTVGAHCEADPASEKQVCDDKQFCTLIASCKKGKCTPEATKPPAPQPAIAFSLNWETPFASIKDFLRNKLGINFDTTLSISGSVGKVGECCNKTKGYVENRVASGALGTGLQGEWPVNFPIGPIPPGVLSVAVTATFSGSASAQDDNCERQPKGSASVSAVFQATLKAGIPGKILPPDIIKLSVEGTIGGTLSAANCVIQPSLDYHCDVLTWGHNGLVVTGTIQFAGGFVAQQVQVTVFPSQNFTVTSVNLPGIL